jgi:hypothetical protein
MLDPKEAEKVYNQLSDIISKAGLDWLIADVRHQISMGKQVTKDIQVESTLDSLLGNYHPKRKGRKAAFIVTQPLTENERLLLLIEALEAATVGLSLGIVSCYEIIGKDNNKIKSLGFAPDTEVNELIHIDSEVLKRKKAVLQLKGLLKELKETV